MEQIKKEPMKKTILIELTEEELLLIQNILIRMEATQIAMKTREGEFNLNLIDKFGAKLNG